MPRNYTTEIDGDEYIGESLVKINDNFFNLDNLQQTLSAVTGEIADKANLALDLGLSATTGVKDINLRLANGGVFYSPYAFYVSMTGRDTNVGTTGFPYRTLDKAINQITNVAKNIPADSSTINKLNNFYIIIKDAATYTLSSTVTLGNIPGTVHIVGSTISQIASANISRPSNTVHQPFTGETITTFSFEARNAESFLKSYPSFKVFQSFGKNIIPLPGYVSFRNGTASLTGFNTPPFTQFLSSVRELENSDDDRYYNYIQVGNEIKEIDKIINDNILTVTTNFTTTVSGVPLFLSNKANWYYGQIPAESYQRLSAVGNTGIIDSFNTDVVVVSAGNPVPLIEGQTKFETSNIFYFNGGASLVISAIPLGQQKSGPTRLDNSGTLLTDKYLSKTQLPFNDITVQGVVGYVPFFTKALYELYRGVYDRVDYDDLLITANGNNYDRPGANNSYYNVINSVKMPRAVTLRMPSNTGVVYIQPLPTTIYFTNTSSAGFKLNGTKLHLHNVYVRGPRLSAENYDTFDIVDTNNIGVQASNNSTVLIDSDCAVANFSIGLHAKNNSQIIVTGDTQQSLHQQQALTVTDNSIGIVVEKSSGLLTEGPRLIVAQNYRDAITVDEGSNLSLQYVDILHNGGTAVTVKNNSTASIGNVCIIGNRYGLNCYNNSGIAITPKVLTYKPKVQPCTLYSPNFIICNSSLSANDAAINVSQGSRLILEEVNLIKNAISGTSINLEDTSTGLINTTNIFGTRNKSDLQYSTGIKTSNNNVVINNTSIHTTQTAVYIRENAKVTFNNIYINNARTGLVLTNNNDVTIMLTNYPSSNNAINSTDIAVNSNGFNNNITYYGELTNYRSSSVMLSGYNNYAVVATDASLPGNASYSGYSRPTVNTLDNKDNKIRTSTY